MKDIRIFVASSKELIAERNQLAFLVLSMEEEFARRGLRVRLAKWEYVDPRMTEERTEDRYLEEMYDSDAALVLFKTLIGKYTREETEKALERERGGYARLKAHRILFKEGDGAPTPELAAWRAELKEGEYGVFSDFAGLKAELLALVDRLVELDASGVAGKHLQDAPPDAHVRRITAFLAADDELAADRDAFADTVLNLNDLLEFRNLRVQLRFCPPGLPRDALRELVSGSEMGLVLYGTNMRAFGREEMDDAAERTRRGENPKKLYVFFRDDGGKPLSKEFVRFRDSFVERLEHFVCQFGGADSLRLSFLLSLERYAGETVEIYSTVSAPTAPKFVGREGELRRLADLLAPTRAFPAGRLPVITGGGGTGKSELVRQFASQLRVQYPGGVFQVDMETCKTWDDAFLGILKGTPNNGIKVEECLGLKDAEGSGEKPKEPMTGAAVRDALLKRARESGPVLLVLDNVEGCVALLGRDGGFRKAFPSGFSERVRVNVVATARVCDVMLREKEDWAVPFPLGDLSQEAALDLLLADYPEADAAERKAAGRVAELLGYRALYLRRVPALIGDLYAQTVCDSYAELAKALEENLLETVAEETEGTHLPDVLWKMTRERLQRMPFGAECVKLAQVASFFSPDGFPQHILKHLWKTVVAPNLDEKKFARALEIVKHHNIFQSVDPVRLHRLDREAILQTAKAEPGLEDELGAALESYGLLPKEDWAFLCEHEKIRAHLPSALAQDVGFWLSMLSDHPDLADRCPWETLRGEDWSGLLREQPQFADRCPWEKLRGEDWSGLLSEQPQFADRCSWEKLDGSDWSGLLREQPQFADRCPWEKLGGRDWSFLLRGQPQFADRCPWEKLSGRAWGWLLSEQPQFADHCPWEKLDGWDWSGILCGQPQFSDSCPWEKLDDLAWSELLPKQPQFADRCPWEKLGHKDWSRLLPRQPQFTDRCPWICPLAKTVRFVGSDEDWKLPLAIVQQPEMMEKSDVAARFEGLLKLDNDDAHYKDDWKSSVFFTVKGESYCSVNPWAFVLYYRPELSAKCMTFEKFNGYSRCVLLMKQPQFAEKWSMAELADRKSACWVNISDDDFKMAWKRLIRAQPQFAKWRES